MKVPLTAGAVTPLAVFSLMLIVAQLAPAQTQGVGPTVIPEVQHVTSPPLRELVQAAPISVAPQVIPLRRIPPPQREAVAPRVPDPVVQGSAGPLVGTTNLLNFDGIAADNFTPPDTNGSVGATQFVETVNTEFAVYDKSNGAPLLAPTQISTLFGTLGGLCSTGNISDPIVLYDKAAGRWLLSILAFNNNFSSNLECVAVSASSDATGSYHLYSFSFGSNLNDYPKFGIWPDAYYLSVNIFPNGGAFSGPEACALDRTNMLAGNAATMQCFQKGATDFSLLPSDMDGSTAPPAGSPNFFIELGTSTTLNLFKFHVDFTTPANTTFTGPMSISVSSYTDACPVTGTCIPQKGTTQQLDSLGDRLMFRLAYRNFGSHESLVVNHSVQVGTGTQTGVRWYEIRDPNGTPTIFQQSTFAPDANFRWMGSIAMDKLGDMAMGYSVSSSSLNPLIRYTGRLPSDSLSTMEAEATIIDGAGSQLTTTRWGDYTSMSIDPVDDCTFWYSNEYLLADGDFNWHTRIGSFNFPSCAAPVTLNPTSIPFNNQLVNTTSTTSNMQLTDTGPAPLNIASITLTGSDPSQFALAAPDRASPACSFGTTIPPGSSCYLGVQFKPTTTGAHSANVSVADDASGSPQTVGLTGTGTAPVPTLSAIAPTSQTAGGGSFTLTATGTNFVAGSVVNFGGTAEPTTFVSATSLTAQIPASAIALPNAGTTVNITVFNPAPGGGTSGGQTFAINNPVGLSGASLNFGFQGVGTSSAAQMVTLTNNGISSLTITLNIIGSNSSDFSETNTCPISPATLAAGLNCAISVTFKPTTTGTRSANVSVADASGSPQTVALAGTGMDFSIGPATGGSTSATVTAGQTATYSLQVSPVSGFNGAVTFSNCSGTPSEAACTTSLASVLVNGTAASGFTVSVTTTAPSMIVPLAGPSNWPPLTGLRLIFLLVFALALLAILGRFRGAAKLTRPGLALAPALALVLLTLAWLGGCGGGGSSTPHNPGTAKGTSTFTLTATSGTATSGVLSHTQNLTLTVN